MEIITLNYWTAAALAVSCMTMGAVIVGLAWERSYKRISVIIDNLEKELNLKYMQIYQLTDDKHLAGDG